MPIYCILCIVDNIDRKEPIIMARKINNVVKVEAVSTISKEVAEVTNFKTLADAETILTKLDSDSSKNRYLVGSVFNAVKEKGLVTDVKAWAENFGYRPNTVYQLGLIAKNFTLDDCIKFGMGKLIEFRNKENMAKLLESGVTEANTSAEIREKVKDLLEDEKAEKKPRSKSEKTALKEALKKMNTTMTKLNELYNTIKELEIDENKKKDTLETLDKSVMKISDIAEIVLNKYTELVNKDTAKKAKK